MSTKETEIEVHLTALSSAFIIYLSTRDDRSRQLEHLDATWRCNRVLEALYGAGMTMRVQYDWDAIAQQFVILDKSTTR